MSDLERAARIVVDLDPVVPSPTVDVCVTRVVEAGEFVLDA